MSGEQQNKGEELKAHVEVSFQDLNEQQESNASGSIADEDKMVGLKLSIVEGDQGPDNQRQMTDRSMLDLNDEGLDILDAFASTGFPTPPTKELMVFDNYMDG